jgi:hypothetical protein
VQRQSEAEKGDKKALAQTEKSIAQTKSQIEKHEGAIAVLRRDEEQVRKQFDADLARYRELKQPSRAEAAAAATKK